MTITNRTEVDLALPDSYHNTEQFSWIVLIKENLEIIFAANPNVFIAGDLLWDPVESRFSPAWLPTRWSSWVAPKADAAPIANGKKKIFHPKSCLKSSRHPTLPPKWIANWNSTKPKASKNTTSTTPRPINSMPGSDRAECSTRSAISTNGSALA
jgi:hypothetical protein